MVEAMVVIQFIVRTHNSLFNEFPYTRVGPLERVLTWHRMNALELVARGEDLQKVIKKMETKELERATEEATQHQKPQTKLLRRLVAKGPTTNFGRGYVALIF